MLPVLPTSISRFSGWDKVPPPIPIPLSMTSLKFSTPGNVTGLLPVVTGGSVTVKKAAGRGLRGLVTVNNEKCPLHEGKRGGADVYKVS